MDKSTIETPKEKTWGAVAGEALHNPYVDIAVGVAVGAAVVLSRGKIMGATESLFPKFSSLLDESIQVSKVGLERTAKTLESDELASTPLARETLYRSPDPFFSKLSPADFNERVLPDITTKLRETPFTTHPVWRFVNSSKPEIAVSSSTEVTAPTFSLKPKGQFFHQGSDVSIDLPHGITEAERTDSILSAIYAKTIYDVDALRGFAYSPTQGFLPHAAFEGAKSYVQSGDSEISRALTERFGALDARSKLIAQRLVDSLKPDSRWSASQMVEQSGLEPTTANLAAATNFHVFHLPEEYQPLGIQVVGQAAEATVTRQLPKLQERFSGPVPQKLVADLVTEEARRTRHTMEFLFQKRVEGFDWKEDESDLGHSEY